MTEPRVFTSPQSTGGLIPNAPFCIGRKGASWFLCFARPFGARSLREHACLNAIYSQDHFPKASIAGHPRFVYNTQAVDAKPCFQTLQSIENPPLRPTGRSIGGLPEVEVLVSSAEVLYACAYCNKWEAANMPRFQRCSGCKARYYCSPKCQQADWKPALHKGDCQLLKEGNDMAVEVRRRMHDNNWWINSFERRNAGPYIDVDEALEDKDLWCYGVH